MKIYVISPSSKLTDPGMTKRAAARLNEMGFEVQFDPAVTAVDTRFAGTDEERAQAFSRAAKSDADIVMASRGGYGISRILDKLEWDLIRQRPKIYTGYSDFTAFNLALYARTGHSSFSGVDAVPDFASERYSDTNADAFKRIMEGERCVKFKTPSKNVELEGMFWGGNLCMVASLVGTPYLPQIDNGILFLEDVGEHPYRVERFLIQLKQSGVLERQQAIVVGDFTGYKLLPSDNGFSMESVKEWIAKETGLTIIDGLPFGHAEHRLTVPNCREVNLVVEDGTAHIHIL